MVNVALGNADVTTCEAGDADGDGEITIDELLAAVSNALYGCGGTPPTPLATVTRTASATPSPTPTKPGIGVACTSPGNCASDNCTDGVCCETDQCPAGERCDILGFKGQCSPPLGVDGQCDKNTDCEEGLKCLFCSSGPPNCATAGKFLCSPPHPPTPTFISTAVPTPTTAIDLPMPTPTVLVCKLDPTSPGCGTCTPGGGLCDCPSSVCNPGGTCTGGPNGGLACAGNCPAGAFCVGR
jgi:hypothetical protein